MNEYKTLAFYYDLLLGPFLWTMRAAVTKAALTLHPENAVDLCCGTGRQLKILKRNGIQNVTGVDLSDEMLNIARKGTMAPVCIASDASVTGIEPASVDLVLINLALHEKSRVDALRVLKEAFRILKPGASLIIGDYNTDSGIPFFPRRVITFIEFLAGGEHYTNYLKYLSYGGLPVLMKDTGFTLTDRQNAGFKGLSIEIYLKQ